MTLTTTGTATDGFVHAIEVLDSPVVITVSEDEWVLDCNGKNFRPYHLAGDEQNFFLENTEKLIEAILAKGSSDHAKAWYYTQMRKAPHHTVEQLKWSYRPLEHSYRRSAACLFVSLIDTNHGDPSMTQHLHDFDVDELKEICRALRGLGAYEKALRAAELTHKIEKVIF